MESRNRDLDSVRALRSARINAVSRSAEGDLAVILESHDMLTQSVYVVKLLDVHPRLGKVAGRRLLAEIGVAPLARVSDLNAAQRRRILAEVGQA
jgi:hypothetical protein